jgi:hypothetical protein
MTCEYSCQCSYEGCQTCQATCEITAQLQVYANIDGNWKKALLTGSKVNIDGVWKQILAIYANIEGTWKQSK